MLLVKLKPFPDESLMSYFHRLASANHYQTPRWLLQLGEGRNLYDVSITKLPEYIDMLSELTGISKEVFIKNTHFKFNNTLSISSSLDEWEISSYIKKDKYRFCPLCFKKNKYHKIDWQLLPLNTCLEHKIYLLDACPNCNRALTFNSMCIGKCICDYDFNAIKTEAAPNEILNMELAYASRLNLIDDIRESIHPTLSSAYFFKLITTFREIISRYPTNSYEINYNLYGSNNKPTITTLTSKISAQLYFFSYSILNNWPVNLLSYLDEHIKRDKNLGLRQAYGKVLRIIRLHLQNQEFNYIKEEIANYLSQSTFSVKEIYSHLNMDVPTNFFSKNEVINKLGITEKRFNKLVDLSGQQKELFRKNKSFEFDKSFYKSIKKVKTAKEKDLSIKEVANKLDVSTAIVKDLIESGYLKYVDGDGQYRKIKLDSYFKFVDIYLANSESTAIEEFISIKSGMRKLARHGYTYSKILTLIKQGIIMTRIDKTKKGLNKIHLHKRDCLMVLDDIQNQIIQEQGLTLPDAQEFLKADVITIEKWIEGGILKARNVIHNAKPSYRIMLEDIDDFRKQFFFIADASKEFSIPENTIRGWAKRGLITAVSGPSINGTFRYVISRKDLENLIQLKVN